MAVTAEYIENFVLEIMEVFRGMTKDDAEALKHEWLTEVARLGATPKMVKFLNNVANTAISKVTYM